MYFGQMYVLTKQLRCFGRALQGLVNFFIFNRIFMFYVYVIENAKETVNKFSKMIPVLTNRERVRMLICYSCILVPWRFICLVMCGFPYKCSNRVFSIISFTT